MGFGLYGLGNFAGGMAGGLYQGQRMSHDMDRQKREREEQERMQGMRRAAGNTLGNVGTQREDGSTYTEENAYGDYATQVAPYDAQASMGARTAGLQMKQLNRNERQNNLAETYMQLQRRLASGDDPMSVFREASRAYGQVNDGKHISMTEDNAGNPMIALTDVAQGSTRMVQFSPENVQAVVRNLYALSSPQAYQQEREVGLRQEATGIARQNADSARVTANATAGYRADQGRLVDGQLGLLNAQRGYWQDRSRDPMSRMPEGDRILLTSIERQVQTLSEIAAKAQTPQEAAQAGAALRKVKGLEFDTLTRLKLIPQGTTRTQFLGLPDPLEMAKQAMATAQDEQQFRASMDQFESIYGSAPEAGQAWNAMQVFMQRKFYDRVRPQTPERGLMRQVIDPWGGMSPEQGLQMRQQMPYGVGKFN